MRSFKQSSINRQLSITFMLILTVSLVIAGSTFVYVEYWNQKKSFADNIETVATMTASRSTAAFEFGDKETLQEILLSLNSINTIELACAYQSPKQLLAFYVKNSSVSCPNSARSQGVYFFEDRIEVVISSIESERMVGSISIHASLYALTNRTIMSILLMLLIIFSTSIIAYLILSRMQRAITEPILDLSKIANHIATEKNYIFQGIPACAKEIRALYLAFENMMKQLKNDEELLSRNESQLNAIIENSKSLITVKALDGKYIFVNSTFIKSLNTSIEKVIGFTNRDFVSGQEAKNQHDKEKIVFQSKEPIEYEEDVLIDGLNHHFLSVKTPLFDINNDIYAICTICTDITESKKQAEFLKRSQKMEALGKLTGGVAHDYNNMLTVILGFAKLIETTSINQPKINGFVQEIMRAANRGAKLTSRLLAFSRNKLVEAKEVNISKLILTEQNMLEKALTARIALSFDLAEDIWPVWLDSDDLEDCILNICINAMHAIEGSGTLQISSYNTQLSGKLAASIALKDGNYAAIQISDSGSGMDASVLAHIFDPFFSTKGDQGTGLGLSQVYGFVQRSEGAIRVESTLGQGSNFYLYFPPSSKGNKHAKLFVGDRVKDYLGNESILVVEDEDALLSLSEEILQQAGYHVVSAKSGEEALKKLELQAFDLLLSDIIMPGMNGYTLAQKVRESYPQMKIQLVSGFDSHSPENKEDAALKENILGKPYEDVKLLSKIRQILEQD